MLSMAISPFQVRPASPDGDRRRARMAIAIATLGIVAILLAYAISPSVRHAVSHAAHSVKHAVSHVFDPDHRAKAAHPAHRVRLVQPLHGVRGLHKHLPAKTGAAGRSGSQTSSAGRTSPSSGG
jgi:hypothetical protein